MSHLISVIVPVYNVQKYVRECLDSILCQTFADFELIIIDDGSTDESGSICDEYGKTDDRITVIHTENAGISEARNRGMESASGRWIIFIDSDDWIEPDMLENLYESAEKHEADFSCCGFYRDYTYGRLSSCWSVKEYVYSGKTEIHRAFFQDNVIGDVAWNKLISKEIIEGFKFPSGMLFEDVSLIIYLLDRCSRVSVINTELYHYRIRKSSITSQDSIHNAVHNWISKKNFYDYVVDNAGEYEPYAADMCIISLQRTLRRVHRVSADDLLRYDDSIDEMRSFVGENYNRIMTSSHPVSVKVVAFMAMHWSRTSSFLTDIMFKARNVFSRQKRMDRKGLFD